MPPPRYFLLPRVYGYTTDAPKLPNCERLLRETTAVSVRRVYIISLFAHARPDILSTNGTARLISPEISFTYGVFSSTANVSVSVIGLRSFALTCT